MTVGEGRVAAGGSTPAEDSTPAQEELTKRRSRLGGFSPGPQMAIRVIAALFALYFLFTTVRAVSLHQRLAVYLGGSLALILLCYPARKGSPGHRPSLVDLAWVALTIAPTAYFIVNHDAMVLRAGIVSDTDVIFGAMITVASLEGCRRVLGWTLPVLAACFVIYAVFGAAFPGMFQHAGFSAERVIGAIFSSNGVYGIVARTYAVYVIIFIIFGAFLQLSGAGTAFTNLALALFGRAAGGAAKASVVSSALAGSVLGAGAANITVTGTFTIPAMKRSGFSAHKAGAIESVASIGGHLLPPVMGAAAFLMASFTGIPYTEIVVVSVVPALMLYVTLYASVHFYAVKNGLKDTTANLDIPSFATTLRRDGLLLLPLVVLVASLFLGYSPFRAAVNGIIATIVIAQVRRLLFGEKRLDLRGMFEGLSQGALQSLMVGATAGVMGVLLAALLLPGTGLMLSSWIVQLSGGSLFIGLLLVILASYVLGMGMTVTAAYIIIAIVAVPALVDFGVPIIVAHLVIIWFSQDSSFTPPFALGSYIAAGIANADPMKTAWQSVLLGKPIYIIPFLMVYTPLLGLDGNMTATAIAVGSGLLGLICFAALAERFLFAWLRLWESAALGVACVMLYWPGWRTNALGLGLLLIVAAPQWLRRRRSRQGMPQVMPQEIGLPQQGA